jgi:hypothetical protein
MFLYFNIGDFCCYARTGCDSMVGLPMGRFIGPFNKAADGIRGNSPPESIGGFMF